MSKPILFESFHAKQRIALVFGNSHYLNNPLSNASKDAIDVAEVLQQIGFDVTLHTNTEKNNLIESAEKLVRQIQPGAMVLVYYSGHGLQIQDKNYLVPINNEFENLSATEIARRCVGLHELEEIILHDRSRQEPTLVIFILDACRTNPFPSGRTHRGTQALLARGLAPVSINQSGNAADLLYLFATTPGDVADDAPHEQNGRFTGALLRYLAQPFEIETFYKYVTNAVMHQSGNMQRPWKTGNLRHEYYLAPSDGIWLRPAIAISVLPDLNYRDHVAKFSSEPNPTGPYINPYRGLAAFDESDAQFFFGREQSNERVINLCRELLFDQQTPGIIWVLGASGSGKSSLVKAGVIPLLRAGTLIDSQNWLYLKLEPGFYPLKALADGLMQHTAIGTDLILSDLLHAEDSTVLLKHIHKRLAELANQRCLLFIDQFEQLLTQSTENERPRFIEQLLAATSDSARKVLAVLTLRTDFLDVLLEMHPQLADSCAQRQVLLAPMHMQSLRTIIEKPAQLVGLNFEEGLVNTLLQEAKNIQSSLPLLEYVLQQLSDAAHENSENTMRWDTFHKLGGVAGVLANQAESVYAKLNASEQLIARSIFLRLIVPRSIAEDTGQRVKILELWRNSATDKLLQKVINVFVLGRLLTAEREASTGQILLSFPHEALIRHWPRLRVWIDENRDDLLIQQRIRESAAQWEQNHKQEGYLWREEQLTEALVWKHKHEHEISATERTFIEASLTLKTKQALKESHIRTGLIALTIIALGAATLSFLLKLDADRERLRAETQQKLTLATKLTSDVQNLKANRSQDRQLTTLLSTEALKHKQPFPLADQLLREDLSVLPRHYLTIPRHARYTEPNYSTDGHYLLLHDWPMDDGYQAIPARLYDLTSKKLVKEFFYSGFQGFVGDKPKMHPLFCPQSTCLYFLDAKHLNRLDLVSGQISQTHVQDVAGLAKFSPDGKFLLLHGTDLALRIIDIATDQELLRIPQASYREADFSVDNSALWTIADNHTVHLIEIASGKELAKFAPLVEGNQITVHKSGRFIEIKLNGSPAFAILDTRNGKLVHFPYPAYQVEILPNGQHAIIWPQPKNAQDHDYLSKGQLWDLAHLKPISAAEIGFSAFSYNQDRLIVAANKQVTLWGLSDNTIIRREQYDNTNRPSVAISARDSTVAVAHDTDLEIWSSKTGKTWQNLKLTSAANEICFAKDQPFIYAAHAIWDYESGELLAELPTSVSCKFPAFNPNLQLLFDAGINDLSTTTPSSFPQTVWQTTVETGIVRFRQPSYDEFLSLNGQRYIAGNGLGITIVDLPSGKHTRLRSLAGERQSIGWEDSAHRFGISGDNAIGVLDIDTNKILFQYQPSDKHHVQVITHDGKSLVYVDTKTVRVFDIENSKAVMQFPYAGNVDSIELSPSNTWLLIKNFDRNSISIWNLKTGEMIGKFSQPEKGSFTKINISADERLMILTTLDKTVAYVADFPSGKLLYQLQHATATDGLHTNLTAEFLQGSQYILTSSLEDHTTQVWNAATGLEYRHWPGQTGGVAKDDDSILTYEKLSLHLWSLKTGKELAKFNPHIIAEEDPHAYGIQYAKLSPDAQHVLIAGDKSIQLFELATGQEISRISSVDKNLVWPVGFSPDGRYFAAHLNDEQWVSLWRPEDMLEETCQRVSRNLTRKEWEQYLGNEPYRLTCPELPESIATPNKQ